MVQKIPCVFLLVLTAASLLKGTSSSAPPQTIQISCSHARYPALCVRTLTSLPTPPNPTPTTLAVLSISAALDSLRSTVSSLRSLPSPPPPVRDCVQQLSDSADQLARTSQELAKHPKPSRMVLDNACTWVSAALTNQDTCLDGVKRLDDGQSDGVKASLGKKVAALERMTSNALYFVNSLPSF